MRYISRLMVTQLLQAGRSLNVDVNMGDPKPYVLDFSEVGAGDVALVGGKCASLGELFRELTTQGVRAVDGFSTTSHAYELLIEGTGLKKKLQKLLKGLDTNDMDELARVGSEARSL